MPWDSEQGTTGDVYDLLVRQACIGSNPGMARGEPIWIEQG